MKKKILTTLLAATLLLSLAACSSGPKAPNKSDEPKNPADAFPMYYAITWDETNIRHAENNPKGVLVQTFGSQSYYDPASEVTIEYSKAHDSLHTALNEGKSDWPEFNDEWKSYGYSAIVNDDAKSARTFQAGLYGERHAKVIKDNTEKLNAIIAITDLTEGTPEKGSLLVPNCMIEITETATIQQIAQVAEQALYLQAWKLVPAQYQGVLVRANGTDYTVDVILAELAK